MDQFNQNPQSFQPQQPQYQASQTVKSKGWIGYVVMGIIVVILVGVVMYLLGQKNITNTESVSVSDQKENVAPVNSGSPSAPAQAQQATQSATPAPKPVVQTQTTVQTTPAPTVSVADFAGQWNGSYSSSALTGNACKASGDVSLSINSSGVATGYANIRGVQSPGTGSVSSSGNLKGSWNYSGMTVSFTGKLNSGSNTGSGTYSDSFGCFGSFSVNR